jgi:anthranilate phosphoribosyltransferase
MVSHRGLRVANPGESRELLLQALAGVAGAAYEIVCLNAGVALYTADCAASIAEGVAQARAAIASGAARRKLDEFVEATHRAAAPG